MKKSRIAAFVLTLFLLFSALVSCGKKASEEAPDPGVTLGASELGGYSILRSDLADELNTRSAMLLREAFEEAGCSLRLTTDFYREGVEAFKIIDTEILVGDTNREETAAFLDSLMPWQWGYALVGTKIVIAGHSSETTREAVNAFIGSVVRRSPLSFSESDRYVYGDVPEGEGRTFTLLSVTEPGPTDDEILSAVQRLAPEVLVRVRGIDAAESAAEERENVPAAWEENLLLERLPEGYAVGFAGIAGETVTEIYYLESAYTFSAGESARLLSYPNLTEAERGALVYSVLRCRETGVKMVFAAAELPADNSSGARMRTVGSFLKNTASYPVLMVGAGLSLDAKNDTCRQDFFASGFTPGMSVAMEKSGEEDPAAAVFVPYRKIAVNRYETVGPGIAYTEFQKARG